MNAKFFAVAVLVAVIGLAGCGIDPNRPDPLDSNRPFPPQPVVSTTMVSGLVSRKAQEVPVYVSIVRHYDANNLEKKVKEMDKNEGRGISLDDLPLILNPPTVVVENSSRFLVNLKSELDKAGFRRVETPCEECLVLITDYMSEVVNTTTFTLFRVRAYYLGNEVMTTRARGVWWKVERLRDQAIALAAKRATEELRQVWNSRIASWRQQVSVIQ